MSLKFVSIKICSQTIDLAPGGVEVLKRLDNPRDLNEALVSVKVEAAAKELADSIVEAQERRLRSLFLP